MSALKPLIDALYPAAQLDTFGGCFMMAMPVLMVLTVVSGYVEITRIRHDRQTWRRRV
ncbi:hypothetical protein ACXR8U_33075 (plasmid) [Methylobacterium radiotolerans]|jgi:hypothetical protein